MKKLIAILLALAICFSFAACGNQTDTQPGQGNPQNNDKPSSSTPVESDEPVEIKVALSTIPTTLDHLVDNQLPAMTLAWCVFDRLVELGDSGDWAPNIAKSWEQVDGKTWKFEIDLNVKFHNGDQLTMEDVEYSFLRLKDTPKSADIGKMIESVSSDGNILTITFVDENNSTPTAVLWTATIVNKKYIEEGGEDALYLKPVGTGPWKVTEFTPSASCRVESWDGYAFEKPQIDAIEFIPIPEPATRYIALETGQVQYADTLTALELELAEENDDLTTIVRMSNSTMCFIFGTQNPPFDNVNVRRALAHAIDRESMASLDSNAVPTASIVFGGYDDYYVESDLWPEFNLEKAKELLAAEGYNESNPLKFEVVTALSKPAMELFQADLLSIGVQMDITKVEFSAYLPVEMSGDFAMVFCGQSAKGNHPLTDLNRLDEDFFGSRNIARYTSPRAQELIEKMYVTSDKNELMKLNAELNDIIATDVPALAAYVGLTRAAVDSRLSGVTIDASGRGNFRNATFTP